jgi:hypothetical protein
VSSKSSSPWSGGDNFDLFECHEQIPYDLSDDEEDLARTPKLLQFLLEALNFSADRQKS